MREAEGFTMWSMWPWEMKRNCWEIARWGHFPMSKARLRVGRITQVSCPAIDNPSIGYPSITNPLFFFVSIPTKMRILETKWSNVKLLTLVIFPGYDNKLAHVSIPNKEYDLITKILSKMKIKSHRPVIVSWSLLSSYGILQLTNHT